MSNELKRSQGKLRKAIAPAVLAAIFVAAIFGMYTTYWFMSNTPVRTYTPTEIFNSIYDNATIERVHGVSIFTGFGTMYGYKVYLNSSFTDKEFDVYVLNGNNKTIGYKISAYGKADFTFNVNVDTTLPLRFIVFYKGKIDGIIVESEPTGDLGTNYTKHFDPTPFLDYVRVDYTYWDLFMDNVAIFWTLSYAALNPGVTILATLLPFSGFIFFLAFLHAVKESLRKMEIAPLFDFFYKLYNIVYKVVNAIINLILKLIDMLTGPAT